MRREFFTLANGSATLSGTTGRLRGKDASSWHRRIWKEYHFPPHILPNLPPFCKRLRRISITFDTFLTLFFENSSSVPLFFPVFAPIQLVRHIEFLQNQLAVLVRDDAAAFAMGARQLVVQEAAEMIWSSAVRVSLLTL